MWPAMYRSIYGRFLLLQLDSASIVAVLSVLLSILSVASRLCSRKARGLSIKRSEPVLRVQGCTGSISAVATHLCRRKEFGPTTSIGYQIRVFQSLISRICSRKPLGPATSTGRHVRSCQPHDMQLFIWSPSCAWPAVRAVAWPEGFSTSTGSAFKSHDYSICIPDLIYRERELFPCVILLQCT